jgi:hypothetical protein
MRIDQLLEVQEVLLQQHSSLAMHLFVNEMSKEEKQQREKDGDVVSPLPVKRRKVEDNLLEVCVNEQSEAPVVGQRIPAVVFGAVEEKSLKRYGLRPDQLTKVLVKQIEAYLDHMTRPINSERSGSKIKLQSVMEH